MSEKLVRIKNRIDTTNNWETTNPVLALGEIGINSDNRNIKIGDGVNPWTKLIPVTGKSLIQNYVYELATVSSTNTHSLYSITGMVDSTVDCYITGNATIILPGYAPVSFKYSFNPGQSVVYSLKLCPLSNGNITYNTMSTLTVNIKNNCITFDTDNLNNLYVLDSSNNFKWGQIVITSYLM